MIPSTIDHLDMRLLTQEVFLIRALTPEQREELYLNIVNNLPNNHQSSVRMQELINSLFSDRIFHKVSSLDYLDRNSENGQIIRVSLASYLNKTLGQYS